MVEIRTPTTEYEWEKYYDLRYRILRQPLNQPRGSEKNEGDEVGIHFALFEDQQLLAIARLDHTETGVSQVRFVAVESNQQGKGYGIQIMAATEKRSKSIGCYKMMLHARDYAVPFYKKIGYRLIEPSYKLFDVLQHYLMEKEL